MSITDDIIALSKAIEKLINDKDYRKMVQINGMERSKAYDLGIIMDKWDEILNKVCK